MVGVNTVKKKKIRHFVILDIDELKRFKLSLKTKKVVENIVIVIYKQCGKQEYFRESYMIEISKKGERENKAVQHLKIIDGNFPKVMKTSIFALIKLY